MAAITLMKTPAETRLAETFEAAKASLPGDAAAREEAFKAFSERGLPHRRVEDFKYTDLRAALREAAPLAEKPSAAEAQAAVWDSLAFKDLCAASIVIVNGHFAREISALDRLPAGVEVSSLADAFASRHPLLAHLSPVSSARDNPVYQLNAAFVADGALIRVAAGREATLHLRFLIAAGTAVATATRTLVVVEEGAHLTLLETHESADGAAHQLNDVVEIIAADRTVVRHVRLNREGLETMALSTLAGKLGAHVSFASLNAVAGAGLARHQVFLTFAGENSKARVDGAAMIRGRQHADTTLVVDHAVPHCDSRELFKTVIDDEAIGVFQGKIIVRHEAQKTDGRMMSAALLLSEGGAMNNKPELEIFADDVQCGHGATSGALDEDLLFYLRARGLPKAEAESLLVQAFLGEAFEYVEHEGAREALIAMAEEWLSARAPA
jgi:Fe-S cluster assembly protein SufD